MSGHQFFCITRLFRHFPCQSSRDRFGSPPRWRCPLPHLCAGIGLGSRTRRSKTGQLINFGIPRAAQGEVSRAKGWTPKGFGRSPQSSLVCPDLARSREFASAVAPGCLSGFYRAGSKLGRPRFSGSSKRLLRCCSRGSTGEPSRLHLTDQCDDVRNALPA
jgi:hypothetical protein